MGDSVIGSTRQVGTNRWLIIDINQTRYEIHDLAALDAHSQELVKRYLLL
jgi:exosome complex RNA-binding protein Rrp4